MAAHQAPPSLGFSRQEHWSGLPFPSPMHESEKWKWSRSVVSDSWRPHGLYVAHQAPLSMGFSRQEYWSGVPLPYPSSEGMRYQLLSSLTVAEVKLSLWIQTPERILQAAGLSSTESRGGIWGRGDDRMGWWSRDKTSKKENWKRRKWMRNWMKE